MSLSSRLLASLAFVIGLAAILGAWGSQVFAGYVPCELCLKERIPYYVGLPLILLALIAMAAKASARVRRALLWLSSFVFLCGMVLGIYHAGAEWRWWPGPASCAGGGGPTATTADLLNALNNIHVVSCTDAAFRFPAGWGLSFAGWNAAVCLVLVVLTAMATARKHA
ncbi:MAG TPA: disulfide bond formation protein B [Bauldia sp.]|nr:disulfide bond formation protein B [Bauldia sp.]